MYINYASTYGEAVCVLENILKDGEAVEYLKVFMCMYVCIHVSAQ